MVEGFRFQGLENRSKAAMRKAISLIGISAREFFKGQFYQEGFTNRGYVRWKDRKRKASHPILTKSGALRDSIKSKTSKAALTATVFTTLEYSEIHNEGSPDGGIGKLPQGGTFKMPKRQFIGDSQKLDKGVEMIIENEIDNLFI